ncbi:aminotransferase class V-fold PLP-dependent enzyme [Haliangium sp.]
MADALAAPPESWPARFEAAAGAVTGFFGMPAPDRFLFTPGCTAALAVAIGDLPWKPGDRVITSSLEHHALLRPILQLAADRGVEHVALPYTPDAPLDLDAAEQTLRRGRVRLVACTMASNVTGERLPIEQLVALAHTHGALCLVDGAQTAGLEPIDVGALGADLFVFAGHKGPQGPQGIGGLYLAPEVAMRCPTATCEVRFGAATPWSPMPSYCDLGSVNMAGVAGLVAGLTWLREAGLDTLAAHRRALITRLLDGLSEIRGITVYGSRDPARRTAAVSLTLDTMTPDLAGRRLREQHGVIAGAGQHCAPTAHEAIGTAPTGTVRLSLGPQHDEREVDAIVAAVGALARSVD